MNGLTTKKETEWQSKRKEGTSKKEKRREETEREEKNKRKRIQHLLMLKMLISAPVVHA